MRNIKLYEVDEGKINFSQRNNEYSWKNNLLKLDANSTCNVTSMCMALDYLGYKFPTGDYEQPEDNLAKFIMESKEIGEMYKTQFPTLYEDFKNGIKNAYTPVEIHNLLSEGTNLWFGRKVTEFVENPAEDFSETLYNNIIKFGKPLVVSGKFNGLNHIVCVSGVVTINDKIEFIKIDDPYGNFRKSYSGSGNDIWLTYDEMINIFKPLKEEKKMYHEFV